MARSRQEVISEMVDSGLFSDDEIRSAVKKQSAPPAAEPVTLQNLAAMGTKGASAIAGGMAESAMPPLNANQLSRLMNINAGQYGISRTLQGAGEGVSQAADAAAKNLGSSPKELALKLINKYRPIELTPSSAQQFIGTAPISEAGATVAGKVLNPVLSRLGRGVANVAERTSGLTYKTPGVLSEAFNDAGLQTAPGIEEVRPIYKAAKAAAGDIKGLVGSEKAPMLPPHKEIIEKALRLAKKGNLSPAGAQTARMSVDAISDSYPDEAVKNMRSYFDRIAKSNQGLAAADVAYPRAIKADALREAFPVNKGGGTSIMKLVTGLGATKFLGPAGIAVDAALLSPAVQGGIATGAGIASRAIGSTPAAITIGDLIREALLRRRQNAQPQ